MVKNDITTSIAKAAPPTAANFWLWLVAHDINWWVAVATLIYVGLQGYVLVRDKLVHRPHPDEESGEVPHG